MLNALKNIRLISIMIIERIGVLWSNQFHRSVALNADFLPYICFSSHILVGLQALIPKFEVLLR